MYIYIYIHIFRDTYLKWLDMRKWLMTILVAKSSLSFSFYILVISRWSLGPRACSRGVASHCPCSCLDGSLHLSRASGLSSEGRKGLDLFFWQMGVSMAMGVPHNGWFIRENPIKMDDLGVPPFMETPKLMLWWDCMRWNGRIWAQPFKGLAGGWTDRLLVEECREQKWMIRFHLFWFFHIHNTRHVHWVIPQVTGASFSDHEESLIVGSFSQFLNRPDPVWG